MCFDIIIDGVPEKITIILSYALLEGSRNTGALISFIYDAKSVLLSMAADLDLVDGRSG